MRCEAVAQEGDGQLRAEGPTHELDDAIEHVHAVQGAGGYVFGPQSLVVTVSVLTDPIANKKESSRVFWKPDQQVE